MISEKPQQNFRVNIWHFTIQSPMAKELSLSHCSKRIMYKMSFKNFKLQSQISNYKTQFNKFQHVILWSKFSGHLKSLMEERLTCTLSLFFVKKKFQHMIRKSSQLSEP